MKNSLSLANALGYGAADKRIDVLRLIEKTGSISQAGRDAGISYKAAWQAVDTLTNLTGVVLVEKVVGGAGGGGARLTQAGKRFLAIAELLEKNRQEVLRQLQVESPDQVGSAFSRLSIRTSMRNHLPCQVKSLEWNGQIVRVFMELEEGMVLVARITRASAELLALTPGLPVLALCKAMAVRIEHASSVLNKKGINILPGHAERVSSGETEDEVVVGLNSGLQVVGFTEAAKNIQVKDDVVAVVDEAAIVVALVS